VNMKMVNGELVPTTPEEDAEVLDRAARWEAGANDRAAEESRNKRNQLLTASDWTQTADAPVDQVAWQDYRQALRDIPQQAGFPTDITWPTKPE
jgi:hypothetical protein